MKCRRMAAFSVCVALLFGGVLTYRSAPKVNAQMCANSSGGLISMSNSQLLWDLKDRLNAGEQVDIGLYAAVIIKKQSDTMIEMLKKEIVDRNNSDVTQTAFYDILSHIVLRNDENAMAILKSCLEDKGVCTNVKARIINEWTTPEKDVKNLSEKVNGKDNKIAYYSLKRLYELDSKKGLRIARKLLNKSANSSNKKVEAARYIIADMIRKETAKDIRKKWIDKCIKWFGTTKKATVKQSWVYSLSYMNDKAALEAILNDKRISTEEKQSVIFENQDLVEPNHTMSLKAIANKSIGKKGCAIFRDGVLAVEWHSGIVTSKKPRVTTKKKGNIVHASGPEKCVAKDSWKSFLDGCKFKGFFKADEGSTKEKRVLISEMARKIASYNIPYCFLEMIQVKEGVNSDIILPEYIAALRCDGLVEYCYEYYGLRVQGDDENWDITQNVKGARRAHSSLYAWVSPKKQSECMRVF